MTHAPYIKHANGRGFWVVVDGKPLVSARTGNPRVFATKAAATTFIAKNF